MPVDGGGRALEDALMPDVNSLLIATAISGLCLSFTVLLFWQVNRGSGFLVTWAVAVVALVGHVAAFWFYAQTLSPVLGTVACALLPVGAIGLYAASRQFLDNLSPVPTILWLAVPYLVLVPPVFALGYDGVALVIQNFLTAVMFVLTAWTYFGRRSEALFSLGALAGLYFLVGLSFALCGTVLLVEGQWRIGSPPSNWAEDINVVISVLGMTGIGALTLLLDQSRLAGTFQRAAMIDTMTGLLNRRALQAAHSGPFGPRKAVVLFDLDHFKQVNDLYGHATGDEVLRGFAQAFQANARNIDYAVRLGGEEFVMVTDGVSPEQARKIAERVAAAFAEITFVSARGETFQCTVSAGIAFGDDALPNLEDVMARADRALYVAKRDGRNRIETGEWRLVG
ncbi:GGDEF domain-containing protein [Mesorhizobium microcysteis]|uniref:diguanylate cyclase n=2 Tax=Neoaquamicrobium microcysteis TaxID=2682781 RepID=A0A5D4GQM0_9HYPH|nr:GGDEF domain-containing protein [Mesorhizobium microcysteis]